MSRQGFFPKSIRSKKLLSKKQFQRCTVDRKKLAFFIKLAPDEKNVSCGMTTDKISSFAAISMPPKVFCVNCNDFHEKMLLIGAGFLYAKNF
jgi:hypothetical protein